MIAVVVCTIAEASATILRALMKRLTLLTIVSLGNRTVVAAFLSVVIPALATAAPPTEHPVAAARAVAA